MWRPANESKDMLIFVLAFITLREYLRSAFCIEQSWFSPKTGEFKPSTCLPYSKSH
jgi:hypothetical protein